MKELRDYTIQQLKNAIYEKELEESRNDAKTLPKEFLPYKKTKTITNEKDNEYKKFYVVHVDDGCEGFVYLVEINTSEFVHVGDKTEELVADTVKHSYLTDAVNEGWIDDVYEVDFEARELSHYGITMLTIDGTSLEEDDYDE